jgi:D-specific alpha-keto acid dehydrogenase
LNGRVPHCALSPTAAGGARSPAPPSTLAATTTRVAVYGCGPDDAALFEAVAAWHGIALTITDAPPSAANSQLAAGHQCISVGHQSKLTPPILLALSRAGVRYISTRSIGFDHVDVSYAEGVGIAVENVAYSPDSVADYTLMLMLMAVRNAQATVMRSAVHDYRLQRLPGRELRDLTVGVVGTGRIGAAVVDRLGGFGCRILAHDRRPSPIAPHVPLDELLEQSDVVTLHTPLTRDTHHLLGGRRIGLMRPGAYLVNTGRGSLVDTEALVEALERGELGGAALDVVEGEDGIFYTDCGGGPVENQLLTRLHRLPNVIITPHTAYYTDHSLRDSVENSLLNCLGFVGNRHHG